MGLPNTPGLSEQTVAAAPPENPTSPVAEASLETDVNKPLPKGLTLSADAPAGTVQREGSCDLAQ